MLDGYDKTGPGTVGRMWWGRRRRERELADAREEALRWYERLGGQIMNLPPGDQPATKQALVDAGERYNAAGSQLERATSVKQYELARESALEGLAYVRAARSGMGLDPGPELPPLASQRQAGVIREDRAVQVQGHEYRASPRYSDSTPYYYPGGILRGRPVPGGYYSEPVWKSALATGAGVVGGLLLFDALFSPGYGFGGMGGYGMGYDSGFDAGYQDAMEDHDSDGDGNFDDGGGGDYDAGSDFGDFGGDFGGGDW
jgi:hypothetical protein